MTGLGGGGPANDSKKKVSEEEGKRVPVLEAKAWNEAEGWHQHFLGEFKDFPEDDDDDD